MIKNKYTNASQNQLSKALATFGLFRAFPLTNRVSRVHHSGSSLLIACMKSVNIQPGALIHEYRELT